MVLKYNMINIIGIYGPFEVGHGVAVHEALQHAQLEHGETRVHFIGSARGFDLGLFCGDDGGRRGVRLGCHFVLDLPEGLGGVTVPPGARLRGTDVLLVTGEDGVVGLQGDRKGVRASVGKGVWA